MLESTGIYLGKLQHSQNSFICLCYQPVFCR